MFLSLLISKVLSSVLVPQHNTHFPVFCPILFINTREFLGVVKVIQISVIPTPLTFAWLLTDACKITVIALFPRLQSKGDYPTHEFRNRYAVGHQVGNRL